MCEKNNNLWWSGRPRTGFMYPCSKAILTLSLWHWKFFVRLISIVVGHRWNIFNDENFPIYGNLQFLTELSHMYWYYGIDNLNDSLAIQPFEQSDVRTIHTRIIFGFYTGLSYRYSRRRRVATRGKIASQFTTSHDTRSPNTLKLQPPSLLSGQVISHSVHSSSQCFVSCRKNAITNYGIL